MPRSTRTKEKPTIIAVAERANVAISTVSRVLNGGQSSLVVRGRVQRAIKELGYTPSVAAQSLVTGRAGCVGLAVNSTQSAWFSQILLGIEEALAPSRKSVLLSSMMLSGRYDPSAVESWIKERRVDGLILVRYARRNEPLLKAAVQAHLPVVLIAPNLAAPADFTVHCDNVQAGLLAAEHLTDLGHTKIAFAGGPRESIDMRHRLEGLEQTLTKRGLSLCPEDRWFGPSFAAESGIEYAERFLSQQPKQRPSAVVLGNDVIALGFVRAVARRGVTVPEHVSVVGFDGIPEGGLSWPGITTVVQPTRAMAASACRQLLDCVHNPSQVRATAAKYDVELLIRESTARPYR